MSPGLERRGSVGWGGDRAALGGGRTPPSQKSLAGEVDSNGPGVGTCAGQVGRG